MEIAERPKISLRHEHLTNDSLVTITSPTTEQSIYVHKGVLCSAGLYFRAALDGPFKESRTMKLEMDTKFTETLPRFGMWLYSRHLLQDEESVDALSLETLAELGNLADERGLLHLYNSAVDTCLQQLTPSFDWGAGLESLSIVYQITTAGSNFRRLIAKCIGRDIKTHAGSYWSGKADWYGALFTHLSDANTNAPKALLADVLGVIAHSFTDKVEGWPSTPNLQAIRQCDYHKHDKDTPISACKSLACYGNGFGIRTPPPPPPINDCASPQQAGSWDSVGNSNGATWG